LPCLPVYIPGDHVASKEFVTRPAACGSRPPALRGPVLGSPGAAGQPGLLLQGNRPRTPHAVQETHLCLRHRACPASRPLLRMDLQGGRKDGQHLARARRGHCLSRGNGRVASPPDPASTHGESFAAGDQTEGSIMKADWGAEILHPTCGKWEPTSDNQIIEDQIRQHPTDHNQSGEQRAYGAKHRQICGEEQDAQSNTKLFLEMGAKET